MMQAERDYAPDPFTRSTASTAPGSLRSDAVLLFQVAPFAKYLVTGDRYVAVSLRTLPPPCSVGRVALRAPRDLALENEPPFRTAPGGECHERDGLSQR